MNKPNGTAPLSPQDIVAADRAAAGEAPGIDPLVLSIQRDCKALQEKYRAEAALTVLVLPGNDLRLMTFGMSKDQTIHMMASVIQSISLSSSPGDQPAANDPVAPAAAAP